MLVSGVCRPVSTQRSNAGASETDASVSKVKFAVAPQILQNFGYTEYIMDMFFPFAQGDYCLKSQLEFPLDVVTAGVAVGLHSTRDTLFAWSFEAGYFSSANDPGGIMKDHDWETVWRIIGPDTVIYWGQVEKISYTESPAIMKSFLITAEGFLRVLHRRHFGLDVWGGFRYQKIEQDIIGYEGWQLLRHSAVARDAPIRGADSAIYYRVTYKAPHLGLRSTLKLGQHIDLNAGAAFALVWASDFDDHLIRHKHAASSMTGHGFLSTVSIRFQMPSSGRIHPFFDVVTDFAYLHASGTQTQHWYADDPITPDIDDTGKTVGGIPHEINSWQVGVGLKAGLAF